MRRTWGVRRAVLLGVIATATTIASAAPALAVTRYAAPGGTAADTVCVTPAAPACSIGTAAGGPNVVAADEAVIRPGNYSESAGDLGGDTGTLPGTVEAKAGSIHGVVGQPRPVIVLDATAASPNHNSFGAFLLGATHTLSHLEVDTGPGSTATSNLTVLSSNAVVDRVIARSSTAGSIACNHVLGTIRDTACLSTGSGAAALGASSANPFTATTNLRGVTAIATGAGSFGIQYFFGAFGPPPPNIAVSAKSVIAQGTSVDVRARATGGATTTINLDHSNYDTADTVTATGGTASVTPAGTGAPNFNVTAAPLLAADGYHQLPGSPTINAGAALDPPTSGTQDIDGQSRQIGLAAPDIGADEFAIASSTSVACAPTSVVLGGSTTCTATVTAAAEVLNGDVAFTSGTAGGTFAPGATCTLAVVSATSSSCDVTYTPGALGSGSHQISASYAGDGEHNGSQGTTTVGVTNPPAAGGGGATAIVDPCPELRERLRRAKKKLKAARKADRPTKKKRAKVRKIRRLLAENNC